MMLLLPKALHAAEYYQTIEQDGLRITIDVWSGSGSPGYIPVNLDITNLASNNRTLEIATRGNGYFNLSRSYYGEPRTSEINLSQTIRLRRGDSIRLTIALPVAADTETFQLQIRERNRVLHRVPFNFQTVAVPELAPALIVANPASAFGRGVRDLPRTKLPDPPSTSWGGTHFVSPGGGPIDVMRDPGRLPLNWLGFTTFRAVFIGKQEWDELSTSQKDALLAWTANGGDLSLVGGDWQTLLPDAQRRPAAMGKGGKAERYLLGQIFFYDLDTLQTKGLQAVLDEMRLYVANPLSDDASVQHFISDSESAAFRKHVGLFVQRAAAGNESWRLPMSSTVPGWPNRRPDLANGFRLPIPGVTGMSTHVYLGILVLFTLLIGPANYWYLKRRRQQALMLLTTPIVSIVFVALLAGYAVAGEGFGIRARAETFTFLDQVSKQAATRATVSLYAAGMAPGNGMVFHKDVAIFPQDVSTINLDLTESQRYASGLLQARTPTNFDEARFQTARERLTFERHGDGISVVNALGGPIRHLFYRDGGRIYATSGTIEPGGRGALTPAELKHLEAIFKVDERSWVESERAERFRRFFLDSQEDGAFYAVLDRSPFWDAGVPEIDERSSFHVVAGYAGGQP